MDFANRLDLFLEVAEAGSFHLAADRRNIDRSVMSKQIKMLEEKLGVRLLNRSTRSLSLTSVGTEMLEQARKVREVINETTSLAQSFHAGVRGQLKISSSTMFGRIYLQKAIQIFMQQYPDVSIELILDDHNVDLIGGGFDLVFRMGAMQDSNMVARKLAENKVILLASEEFIARHGMPKTPQQLATMPAVIYKSESHRSDKLNLAPNHTPNEFSVYTMQGKYFVNEVEVILEAVKQGMGYAKVAAFMLSSDIKQQGLVQLLPDYQQASHGDIYAMYPHRNQPPLVKLFIDTVQEIIGTPPIWETFLSINT